MEYCLNIDMIKLKTNISSSSSSISFTFLNHINYKYLDVYYDMIYNYEEFKLKNLYNFIYQRILKLNKLYDIELLKKNNTNLTHSDLNSLLTEYINTDIIKSIIIINSIQQYYYPLTTV